MNITKEMIDKAKQVELKDLEPTLRSIIQIAMHVRDNSGEFEDFVNPLSDTWRHGFTDAMHAIVRFIMLAHIASIEEAWHEFPDLN
ncbi:hypothetical protein M2124_001190 [Polynucleobacter sphagniphilus]|uniref:hypothetical protein n=1 Tax=Polynucleobacter sphagniphilus TaxID=1743169 RepID=UPI0024772113|nr:hypothetical protein [Polynucleobacter sphagniphilus]MDH6154918.1 hypothetical protein [Polynucleobacter sphagniphilus]